MILDLTRCRGYDTDSFADSADRKVLKNGNLAYQLEGVGLAQVQILALLVGHAENLLEIHWNPLTVDE